MHGCFLDRNCKEFSQLIYTPAVEGEEAKASFMISNTKASVVITNAYLVSRAAYDTDANVTNITMKFDYTQYKNYPYDPATEFMHMNIAPLQRNNYFIKPFLDMQFQVNYSGHDEYPIFVLRIQFKQNVICSSIIYAGFPLTSQPVYKVSGVGDVYVAKHFPHNEILLRALGYTGHNVGACHNNHIIMSFVFTMIQAYCLLHITLM